jgi:hypothetical protein
MALFILGLAFPKAWFDWGFLPPGALAVGAMGLGAALAPLLPRRIPSWAALAFAGSLAVLYLPAFALPWGLALGLAWGVLDRRMAPPGTSAVACFALGLALSFSLHANAWLPFLRHVIWLGN